MEKTLLLLLAVAVIASLVPSTQQQQTTTPAFVTGCQNAQVDLAFVLDVSSSNLTENNIQSMKSFVTEFLAFDDINIGLIRVAVVTSGNVTATQFFLNTYRTKMAVNSAIASLRMMTGVDNLGAVLKSLRQDVFKSNAGDRLDIPNVVILLTSSDASNETAEAIREAEWTRASGVEIYGIGVGNNDTSLVGSVVSKPRTGHEFVVESFSDLPSLVPQVYDKFNKFCQTPPPVPACFMGATDLWLLVDVSSRAESLARGQTTGDFQTLKNGLTKMADIIQDPSVSNPGVSLGLIAYSDVAKVLSDIQDQDSVVKTVSAIQQLPGEVAQGGSSLIQALNNIKSAPGNSSYRSYVAIVGPESSFSDSDDLMKELARLKKLGFTIAIFLVSESGSLDIVKLQREASGSRFFYRIAGFSDLEAATKNFTRDRLCRGMVSNTTGLCVGSGHRQLGVGVVSHPADCDKYIQCYYDPINHLDLAVVRQCPAGLHWYTNSQSCRQPPNYYDQYMCTTDRCLEDCSPHKAYGACGAYWTCKNGRSAFACCPLNFTFVPDVGCQFDAKCTDTCGQAQWCGKCQKKPNWEKSAGYDVMPQGGYTWMPRPCFYGDFDIVDCGCTAPRDHVCPADREFDFAYTDTLTGALAGTKEGIRVTSVKQESEGISLGSQSSVHFKVDKAESEDEPFTLELKFREMDTFSPYGEVLVSSGLDCGGGNSLLITATDQFVFAEARADGQVAEVKVPTQGLAKEEFKKLLLSRDNGVLSLSISDSNTQYIATTEAPSNINISCGLNFGRGVNKLSFEGEIQKIAFYSCAWKKLYETED